jgi:cell division protease FtsH
VTGTAPDKSSALSVLFSLLPFLFIIVFFVWLSRRAGKQVGGLGGIMGIGKSKAKIYDEERPSTHFADIAGYDGSKAEVMEVVDFLQHPKRYARACRFHSLVIVFDLRRRSRPVRSHAARW